MRSLSRSVLPDAAVPLILALVATTAPSSFAQAAQGSEDPYGLTGSSTSAPASPTVDSAEATSPEVAPPPTLVPDTANVGPVTPAAPAPRARVTRETTINPMDQNRGNYRNPKKALFMSLIVPGLGQAYVGQSAFTYARAAFYFGTEVTLGLMWYQYTVVKYDRKTKQYRQYADQYWSQTRYEDSAFNASLIVDVESFEALNAQRENFCDAVVPRETSSGATNPIHTGCTELTDTLQTSNYQNYRNLYANRPYASYASPVDFYALIGDYQEFVGGWDDVVGLAYSPDSISGTSARRSEYNRMRQQAQDFSRMQAWFIGGIVINHIASAVDAALTARYNNRILYEGEARWYDRVKVDGGLAFDAGRPRTHMSARLSF
jgi:Family of unknown function (DUF5683)